MLRITSRRLAVPDLPVKYFDDNYDGPPFELLGSGHLVAIALFVLPYMPFAIPDWRSRRLSGQ